MCSVAHIANWDQYYNYVPGNGVESGIKFAMIIGRKKSDPRGKKDECNASRMILEGSS